MEYSTQIQIAAQDLARVTDMTPAEYAIEGDTESIDVALLTPRFSGEELGRHIAGRARNRIGHQFGEAR